jgi:DNA-binding CsgD family transcriptional regulator
MSDPDPIEQQEIARMLRGLILRHFAEDGCVPDARGLAHDAGLNVAETQAALRRIEHPGDIVVAPGSGNVWMAHPFSAVPTPYPVYVGARKYWADCAWDALLVGLLLEEDSDIVATCPDCGEEMRVEIRNQQLHGEGVIHCLIPPSKFFDNIGFTCATTLLFKNVEHARRWCEQRHTQFGGTVTLQQAFELNRRMAVGRMRGEFTAPTGAERSAAYRSLGATDEFWLTWPVKSEPLATTAAASDKEKVHHVREALLTDREREILAMLAEGDSKKAIAHRLSLSPHTVDTHVRNIYAKLRARSRGAAIAIALRARIV